MERDMVLEILSMIGSLLLIVLVLVLTYYATRWYARRAGRASSGKYIRIIDRSALGAGASVTIVQVGERYYLLGVGDKSVNMLGELEDFEEREEAPPVPASVSQAFRKVLDKARGTSEKGGDDRP